MPYCIWSLAAFTVWIAGAPSMAAATAATAPAVFNKSRREKSVSWDIGYLLSDFGLILACGKGGLVEGSDSVSQQKKAGGAPRHRPFFVGIRNQNPQQALLFRMLKSNRNHSRGSRCPRRRIFPVAIY